MRRRGGLYALFVCLACCLAPPSVAAQTPADGGRWTLLAPLLTPRVGHTATLLLDGQILAVGGATPDSNGHPSASVERYDPSSNRWVAAAPVSVPRIGHTAVLLRDGRVLVVGGYDVYTAYASAELYDPRADSWTYAGRLTDARSDHTATLLADGRVLVVGGHSGGAIIQRVLASAEVYDPTTNRWSPASSLTGQRTYHAATLLPDGEVLVAGGLPQRHGEPAATTERYDPATNRWTSGALMARWRYDHTLVTLHDGTVLVFGGDDLEMASAVYDPRTDIWTASGNTQAQHRSAPGFLLPDGRVLAVDAEPEVYDPVTRRWTTVAPLNVPRYAAPAIILPTGQVVMVGGFALGNGGGSVTGAVERNDPAGLLAGLPNTGGGWAATRKGFAPTDLTLVIAWLGIASRVGMRCRRARGR